jgi:hypothetical protein
MVGLINLFVSILKYPSSPAAQSDVALLDSAGGAFWAYGIHHCE